LNTIDFYLFLSVETFYGAMSFNLGFHTPKRNMRRDSFGSMRKYHHTIKILSIFKVAKIHELHPTLQYLTQVHVRRGQSPETPALVNTFRTWFEGPKSSSFGNIAHKLFYELL
jgi:hypothetical protein